MSLQDRVNALDEKTVADIAKDKGHANRVLMLKKIVEENDTALLVELEAREVEVQAEKAAETQDKQTRRDKRQAAKQALEGIKKSDFNTVAKLRDLVWQLKDLVEEE